MLPGPDRQAMQDYDEVDNDIVWQILTVDFPALIEALEGVLAQG
jgi:uncharacterized protein with HEPN domain